MLEIASEAIFVSRMLLLSKEFAEERAWGRGYPKGTLGAPKGTMPLEKAWQEPCKYRLLHYVEALRCFRNLRDVT